jgi:hypothetical protein
MEAFCQSIMVGVAVNANVGVGTCVCASVVSGRGYKIGSIGLAKGPTSGKGGGSRVCSVRSVFNVINVNGCGC